MPDFIQGTFHFHSIYSHDGRQSLGDIAASLRGRGFTFCIMTEHFEDFDGGKFAAYLAEIQAINRLGGFVFVPGMEINLSGVDTIVFPVTGFTEMLTFAASGKVPVGAFSVIAHPSKYSFAQINRHLERYTIDGIELWNQQADSRYLPPLDFLRALRSQSWRTRYRYLFGCDLHDIKLTVANFLKVPIPSELTPESIVMEVAAGKFVTRNVTTGIEFDNEDRNLDLDVWLDDVLGRRYHLGMFMYSLRRILKKVYRLLPRETARSLNNVKNLVRNKV